MQGCLKDKIGHLGQQNSSSCQFQHINMSEEEKKNSVSQGRAGYSVTLGRRRSQGWLDPPTCSLGEGPSPQCYPHVERQASVPRGPWGYTHQALSICRSVSDNGGIQTLHCWLQVLTAIY